MEETLELLKICFFRLSQEQSHIFSRKNELEMDGPHAFVQKLAFQIQGFRRDPGGGRGAVLTVKRKAVGCEETESKGKRMPIPAGGKMQNSLPAAGRKGEREPLERGGSFCHCINGAGNESGDRTVKWAGYNGER